MKARNIKTIVAIIIVSIFVGTVIAQKRISDSEFDGVNVNELMGSVKSIAVDRFFLIQYGEEDKSEKGFVYKQSFDEAGNNVETISNAGRGQKITTYGTKDGQRTIKTLSFDDLGKILCFPPTCSQSDITADYHEIYSDDYNSIGQLIKRRRYRNDEFFFGVYNYEYDEKGRIFTSSYANMSARIWKDTFKHDSNGTLIGVESISVGDGLENFSYTTNYSEIKFDKVGNWIERTVTQVWSDNPGKVFLKYIDFRKIEYYGQ